MITFARLRLLALGAAGLAALGVPAPPAAQGATVEVELTAKPATVRIAPEVRMRAWTFNGRLPGPVIRAVEGDRIDVTLRNSERMGHSVDFHAAEIAPDVAFSDVAPGETKRFSFLARRPGVFLYHCGTAPVLEHIGMGMFGAIVVEPEGGRSPARERVLVQSELYGKLRGRWLKPSYEAMQRGDPRFVAFNGKAFRYRDRPIQATVGVPQRLYVVSAGPTLGSDFHVVGEVFDTVEPDGNPLNAMAGISTYGVPAGGGAMFELSFDEPGTYPFVTHAFRWADAGALGLFEVGPAS